MGGTFSTHGCNGSYVRNVTQETLKVGDYWVGFRRSEDNIKMYLKLCGVGLSG